MAICAEHRLKFESLHRKWWRLQISEKFLMGRKTQKKKIIILSDIPLIIHFICKTWQINVEYADSICSLDVFFYSMLEVVVFKKKTKGSAGRGWKG